MSKARVLAVDDQRYFRELLEGQLRETGYEVETVAGAEAALERLEHDVYDIVLTDLVMPGVDGTELVARIKARWPEQPVVVLTGVNDVRSAVEAMKQGATEYLLKPFDREDLAEALEKILQRRRLEDEHARLIDENLEYLGVLDLYERLNTLHRHLDPEPLAERLIEELAIITHAQSAVIWCADSLESNRLHLKAARGLIRIEEEAPELRADGLGPAFEPLVEAGRSLALPRPEPTGGEALFVPLRHGRSLIGLARLSDPADGASLGGRKQASAEKFAQHASTALVNALRLGALQRHALRDPRTDAYTEAFFEDATRQEIHKDARFGRSFSLIVVDVDPANPALEAHRARVGETGHTAWWLQLVEQVRDLLRSTDRLAVQGAGRHGVLVPETDAIGAAILKQRIREHLLGHPDLWTDCPDLVEGLALACVTYPNDGTQLETLFETLDKRVVEDRASPLRTFGATRVPFSHAVDRLIEQGRPQSEPMGGEVTRFLLREVERRPRERGLLLLSAAERDKGILREGLARLRNRATRTEIVVVGEERDLVEEGVTMTCIPASRAGTDRPFAVYFGEGPAYAMVSAHRAGPEGLRVFHSDDRSLVEYLACQFQQDLGLALGGATR